MPKFRIEDALSPERLDGLVNRAKDERSAYMRACLIGLAQRTDKGVRRLWSLAAKAGARVRQPMESGRTSKYRSYKGAVP